MKKIWVGTSFLVLSLGLAGISFAKDQTTEKMSEKTLPPLEHAKTTEKSEKKVEMTDNAVVASVNGTNITMHELILEMNQIGPSFIKDPRQRTPEVDRQVKQTAIDILIFRELAVQEAVRQGIKVKPSAVEEARKQLKQNFGSEDNYKNYLQKMNLTEESLGRMLKRDILFNQITAKEIFQKAKGNDKVAIEKRKGQWERALKKKAKIVILPE